MSGATLQAPLHALSDLGLAASGSSELEGLKGVTAPGCDESPHVDLLQGSRQHEIDTSPVVPQLEAPTAASVAAPAPPAPVTVTGRIWCCRAHHNVTVGAHQLPKPLTAVVCVACHRVCAPPSQDCVCGARLTHDFCKECVVFSTEPTFHCSQCGLCRCGSEGSITLADGFAVFALPAPPPPGGLHWHSLFTAARATHHVKTSSCRFTGNLWQVVHRLPFCSSFLACVLALEPAGSATVQTTFTATAAIFVSP